MNNIVAIIVTFNRKELLGEAIEALCSQTIQSFDIMVVDNASTDGTKEYIFSYVNNGTIQYFNTGKNIGGAGGFHFGMKKALMENYDYIWLMDDDTIPDKDCLENLVKAKEILHNQFSFLSSYVYWIDHSPCVMNFICVFEYCCIQNQSQLKEGIIPIKTGTFVSAFINTQTVKKVGLPIKEFFIWSDDTEYTYRLSQVQPAYFIARSQVLHKMNTNVSADIVSCDKERIDRYSIAVRNRFYIAKKYGIRSLITFHSQFIKNLIRFIKKADNAKIKRCLSLMKGYGKGLFFHPQIEKDI